MTATHAFHGGIKAGDSVALALRRPDERIRHGEAVAVFAGASGDDYDFLTHNRYSPCFVFSRLGFVRDLYYHES